MRWTTTDSVMSFSPRSLGRGRAVALCACLRRTGDGTVLLRFVASSTKVTHAVVERRLVVLGEVPEIGASPSLTLNQKVAVPLYLLGSLKLPGRGRFR